MSQGTLHAVEKMDMQAAKKLAVGQMVRVLVFSSSPGLVAKDHLYTGKVLEFNDHGDRCTSGKFPSPGWVRVQFTKLQADRQQFHDEFRAVHLETLVGDELAWATAQFETGKYPDRAE